MKFKKSALKKFPKILDTVSKYTGEPKVRILSKGRSAGQVTSRYVLSCVLDYLTQYSCKDEISELLPIGRCNMYNGWTSLMSTYIYNQWDRKTIDDVFLRTTGKTFPDCERDMYNNLYKRKGMLYDEFKYSPEKPSMKRRISDRIFYDNQLNQIQ